MKHIGVLIIALIAVLVKSSWASTCSVDMKVNMLVCLDDRRELVATYRSYGSVNIKRGPKGQLLSVDSMTAPALLHVDIETGGVTVFETFTKDGLDHKVTIFDGGIRNGEKEVCTRRQGTPDSDKFTCTTVKF